MPLYYSKKFSRPSVVRIVTYNLQCFLLLLFYVFQCDLDLIYFTVLPLNLHVTLRQVRVTHCTSVFIYRMHNNSFITGVYLDLIKYSKI